MFSLLFEQFKPLGAQCQVQAVLSLYASGRTTGNVLDSGDGVTHIIPVHDGYGLKQAVEAEKRAGRKVTEEVVSALNKYHSKDLTRESNAIEICKKLKETVCRIAYNYKEEMAEIEQDPTKAITYTFQDGSVIEARELQILPSEFLFTPSNIERDGRSITDMLDSSLNKTNIQIRVDLLKNTVVSGGTSMFKGFRERTEKELKSVVPDAAKEFVKVMAPENRKNAVFAGGSILSSLAAFQECWITLQEWQENEAAVFKKKSLFD